MAYVWRSSGGRGGTGAFVWKHEPIGKFVQGYLDLRRQAERRNAKHSSGPPGFIDRQPKLMASVIRDAKRTWRRGEASIARRPAVSNRSRIGGGAK